MPAKGTYQARVRLEYGMWTETWEGTFIIGEDITRELEQFDADRGEASANPWGWLIAGAAALALAATGWVLHRLAQRRRRERNQSATWSSGTPSLPQRR